ncbi:allantoicase [Streptomyces sp. LcepLS]|nr:allantoicase [Streptomyces sp. LcepLS]
MTRAHPEATKGTTPTVTATPPAFTGPAQPYSGGDPYADYRATAHPFTDLPDLADRGLGGCVVAANDEFFAERENLLVPDRPRFDPAAYGHKGKIMDGWETRRRRGTDAAHPWPDADDHDWALIRLATPGVVRGLLVDTAHFRGNHPRAVSVEATALPGHPSPGDLLAPGVRWTTLVPRTEVGGHAANGFPVAVERRFTHVRLRQYPDGGIARLRVHGDVVPDPRWLAALGTFDLAAQEHGGRAEDASDRFYSPPAHTLRPGRSRSMHEGWETRRRRDEGHDWVRYALAGHGEIRAVEIDTACYLGNAAGWAALSVREDDGPWTALLPPTRLQPDTPHRFLLDHPVPATHARLDIHPDGGVSRLRLHGTLSERGRGELERRVRELSEG